ncbi:hypothetical protein [[Mycoplasma] mobile]|uniref:Expressed protein n=1 Tax=Mycoplasma mobile (strain ATCC 43663 / 163K / NCTC 11711) TaxID=267748 RepID=Q6KIR2_MYCM1|nr:hypothetical protein [[Mycoplasma] mobile]AAT27514.1 expressed protein [Mycoplasma mobile 163K]
MENKKNEKNFEWFKNNFESLKKAYSKKYFLIEDEKILANFDDLKEASYFLSKEENKDKDISIQSVEDLNLKNQNFFSNIGRKYAK